MKKLILLCLAASVYTWNCSWVEKRSNYPDEELCRTELQVKKAEAEIEIARAEGTSKAQLALAKSITHEMIKWKELENTSNAIQKWDGKLPTTNMGNAVPFVNVK